MGILLNCLHTYWRNLLRQKIITTINILGLAVGLGVFILTSLYVSHEYSYERHWQDADRLMRLVVHRQDMAQETTTTGSAPAVALPRLLEFLGADVEVAARLLYPGAQSLVVDSAALPGGVFAVDRDYIELFDLEVVAGSLAATLAAPNRVALHENDARRLFGAQDPVGKTLTIKRQTGVELDLPVTAVFRLPAGNTELPFALASFTLLHPAALGGIGEELESWSRFLSANQYFRLREGADLMAINRQLETFVDTRIPADAYGVPTGGALSDVLRYELQPVTARHFNPGFGEPGGDQRAVNAFAAVGVLVLLIGISNFIMLAVAGGLARRREIAARKSAGASRAALLGQFVGEAVLHTLAAFGIALVLVELLLPVFATITDRPLALDYGNWRVLLLLGATFLVTWLGSALYPALILSRLQPESVLRAGIGEGLGKPLGARSLLVGFQFSIATGLLIATLVLYWQLDYTRNRDFGFNPDNLLSIQGGGGTALASELRNLPGVTGLTRSSRMPNMALGFLRVLPYSTAADTGSVDVTWIAVDHDFFTVLEMPIVAGRAFDPALDPVIPVEREDPEDVSREPRRVVLNQAAVRGLGFASVEAAVGADIQRRVTRADGAVDYRSQQVVGVVADSQLLSLRQAAKPEVYVLSPDETMFINLRFTDAAAATLLREVDDARRRFGNNGYLNSWFIGQTVTNEFAREHMEGRLLLAFAALSILVSCLGLYALAVFETRRRVREIGIRKVLGAGLGTLLQLFLWQFSRPVLLANLIAWPLSLWAMTHWLQRFPYRIDHSLLFMLCLGAALLALCVAGLTVGGTVLKAAQRMPALALRHG